MDPKFPLLKTYNTWHQNAWNALLQLGYTPNVEKKVIEPSNDKEKFFWMLVHTKYFGCLRSLVSFDIMFQIEKCTNSHDAGEKLKSLYGSTDEVWGYQIDNEVMSLDPKSFYNIQDYVTKVNDLSTQCNSSSFEKQDTQLVYIALIKLGLEYAAFVSSFYTRRLTMGSTFTTPYASFFEMLI